MVDTVQGTFSSTIPLDWTDKEHVEKGTCGYLKFELMPRNMPSNPSTVPCSTQACLLGSFISKPPYCPTNNIHLVGP